MLLGNVQTGDEVQILRREQTYRVPVKALGVLPGRQQEKTVAEGAEGILILSGIYLSNRSFQ